MLKPAVFLVLSIAAMAMPNSASAQVRCASNIDPGLCQKAQAVLEQQIQNLTANNVSSALIERASRAPERPLTGTPCFYRYGANLDGIITKCIEPRYRPNPKHDQPIVLRASQFDACPTTGEVVGLDPRGDNYLSVLAGPSGDHREVDRLGTGEAVYICNSVGNWLAVIYPRAVSKEACGVSSPVPSTRRYRGPCEQGWVHRRYIREVAG